LLTQHFLKDVTIMLSGMAFHAADTHRITSRLNCAVYDSLLDFWRPSYITMVHDKLE
jgi:hypothetical protein